MDFRGSSATLRKCVWLRGKVSFLQNIFTLRNCKGRMSHKSYFRLSLTFSAFAGQSALFLSSYMSIHREGFFGDCPLRREMIRRCPSHHYYFPQPPHEDLCCMHFGATKPIDFLWLLRNVVVNRTLSVCLWQSLEIVSYLGFNRAVTNGNQCFIIEKCRVSK